MLRESYSVMRKAIASLLLGLSGAVFAQDSAPDEPAPYIPLGNLQNASQEEIEEARKFGEALAREMLRGYSEQMTPEIQQETLAVKRRADDIANKELAENRNKVLEFLGLDPESESALYIYVSWSMPLELLRSYAIEAMWSGGTLVFRGVPPGKELAQFIVDDLRSLVYNKGASANISIDPRLYDAYDVKMVPTIVFTNVRSTLECGGAEVVPVQVDDIEATYDKCPPIDPSRYAKMSGAVTTNFALETFIQDGFVEAKPFLAALSRGWREGKAPSKDQKPFAGKWDDVLSPDAVMEMQREYMQANPAQ